MKKEREKYIVEKIKKQERIDKHRKKRICKEDSSSREKIIKEIKDFLEFPSTKN
jgi:hypothetical protein